MGRIKWLKSTLAKNITREEAKSMLERFDNDNKGEYKETKLIKIRGRYEIHVRIKD